jgi:hypothetical protein
MGAGFGRGDGGDKVKFVLKQGGEHAEDLGLVVDRQ